MFYILAFFVFVFGTIIGSFLNVVILRYNTGLPIFSRAGRSQCFSCGKILGPAELVPVLSFLFLSGRCSVCKTKISIQYPAVELLTGLLFLLIFIKNYSLLAVAPVSFALFFTFHMVVWSILIVITFYDLRHKIIPNGLVYALCTLTLLGAVFIQMSRGSIFPDTYLDLANFLAGPLFFLFFSSLWLVSGGRWIGLGDAKLVLAVGFLLGLAGGVSALILSFWTGAIFGIFLILVGAVLRQLEARAQARVGAGVAAGAVRNSRLSTFSKNLRMKSELPFAPFIILGTLIVFFCSMDILGLSNFF